MKRNGFTLVELLTTVTILGILAAVATVAYTKYIDFAKKENYKDAEITMRAACESFLTYCSTSPFASDDCAEMPTSGNTVKIDISTLTEKGFMEEIVDQNKGGHCNGYVEAKNHSVSDQYDVAYKVCLQCSNYKSKDCQ